MLMKYIEGYVYNDSKVYSYDNCFLQFDENKYSLNISDEYLENDINNNICYLYSIFDDLVKRRLYSSESNAERAARTGALLALLSISYCTDISRSTRSQGIYFDKVKTLEDLDKYCSAVKFEYNFKTKEIKRYEIYGDIYLGTPIERPISYYAK